MHAQLSDLNSAQRDAVTAPLGHYLVLAGAGSGKTRVLTQRIAYLLEVERVSAWSVLAVTFTNKAAAEMRHRVDVLLPNGVRGMWIGTFHSISHRLLRQHFREAGLPETFQILDADDQLRMVKRVIQAMGLDETRWPPRQATWFINARKDEGKRASAVNPGYDPTSHTFISIYKEYEEQCQRAGLVDFAELLLRAHEMFLKNADLLAHYQQRFSQLLVDEFQDTNTIQYAFIRLLAGQTGQVFVVGDDDQAIYGWRGAKVENVQQFLRDFGGSITLKLEQNYRSTANILKAANAVIGNNPDRLGKSLWTDGTDGEPIELYAAYNEQEEARFVIERIEQHLAARRKPSECAILYRSNAQSRLFEEQLIRADIPYRVYGGLRFFERAEIKDVLAYLRLLMTRIDDAAFERAVNTPPRGIGDRTLDIVRARARRDASNLWDAVLAELLDNNLAARAKTALRGFVDLIESLVEATANRVLAERFSEVIERTGLRVLHSADSRGLGESKVENLDELINVASRFLLSKEDQDAGFDELTAFLSQAALEAGDAEGETWEDCVQLMSLHAAKGLEFPTVFLVGLEEGLFPGHKSIGEAGRLEEERRLAYVGITRAREKLFITYAESRRWQGSETYPTPSRFVGEIPAAVLHEIRPRLHVSRPVFIPTRRPNETPSNSIQLGKRVRHNLFGEGIVIDAEGNGEHARVQVNFENGGSKWLVMAYANLQMV